MSHQSGLNFTPDLSEMVELFISNLATSVSKQNMPNLNDQLTLFPVICSIEDSI
jgi:hypothetical protein